MRPLTEAEVELSARALNRDTAARENLARTELAWPERTTCALTAAVVMLLSSKWHDLPVAASALLTGCAAAMPYLYFEIRRLRKQVIALTQLVLHSARGDGDPSFQRSGSGAR